jgi:hypothetical protein
LAKGKIFFFSFLFFFFFFFFLTLAIGVVKPPLGQMRSATLTIFFFFFKYQNIKKKIKKSMGLRVTIFMVPHVADMKIRQFWTDKGIISVFFIAQVPKKKMKIKVTKNKIFKIHGSVRYLTLSGLNTIHPLEVVGHFQFGYQNLKYCNIPPQSFKKFQFKHFVWFDYQDRRNFDHFKTTSFCSFGDLQ